MKEIELLAPAGSMEGLKASIQAGADAVYIGGTLFGARAFAHNLSKDELLSALDYAHIREKKLYLTVNTLLKNQELYLTLPEYLRPFYEAGLDAVIVQDPGVMRLIHECFPDLPIHASTQMTLTMAEGANQLKKLGVTRIVTARELSLEEIRRIHQGTTLEIESFVHGALCYCYSGQCLMSSMIGGRSGNRGRCAQPCRMEYHLKKEAGVKGTETAQYMLSPKDICTLEFVPELMEAGIHSFKIEGRMKRYEYAAGVVSEYRRQIDRYFEYGAKGWIEHQKTHQEDTRESMIHLQDLYNRGGFHEGYYHTHNGKDMMSLQRPNHSGVLVGEVTHVTGIRASIALIEQVNAQDVLEIRSKGSNTYEFTVKAAAQKGTALQTNFKSGSKVTVGDLVFRTKNNQLLTDISENYYEQEIKLPVHGYLHAAVGEPLRLTICRQLTSGVCHEITVFGENVTAAMKQPITQEKLKEQLKKTMDTPFVFDIIEIDLYQDVFIPVSKINELRRNGLSKLQESLAAQFRRHPRPVISKKPVKQHDMRAFGMIAYVKNMEQFQAALEVLEVEELYLDLAEVSFDAIAGYIELAEKFHKRVFLVMPHVFRAETYDLFQEHKKELYHKDVAGFIIKNFEELEFLDKSYELRLDYNMYVMNEEARLFYQSLGITHMTAPYELNEEELADLGIMDMDLVVYGYLPLMVSAQCLRKNTTGCQKMKQGDPMILVDRMQNEMMVRTNCRECYNTIYNAKCLSLLSESKKILKQKPNHIRLDFTIEHGTQVKQVLRTFADVFLHGKEKHLESLDDTKGHFNRGIL